MKLDVDVLVLGGGLSGLAVAHGAAKRGASVEVLEAMPRAGGVIGSVLRDGALYETGPNSVLDTTPLVNEHLDALGIRAERTDASPVAATRYIVRAGRLLPLPTSPNALLTSHAFSLGAKWRLWREPFVAPLPSTVEESIAAFVRRRLGIEILDYAVDPFVSGVYAGDPERISMPAAFPQIHAIEQKHGSVIKGMFREARERRRSGNTQRSRGSFSFRGGMQTLTDALARNAGRITTRARAQDIQRGVDGEWKVRALRDGETVERRAKVLIVALPAYEAGRLMLELAPPAAQALAAIDYAPVASVATLYRRADVEHSLDGFGFLVPARERRRILGTLFSSSLFEGRAPPDNVLLTSFVGGVRHPDLVSQTDSETAGIVRGELESLLGVHGEPLLVAVTRWTRAIPQYNLGHRERLLSVDEAERILPGLLFCANYRGGVSVGDCIKSAHATTDAALRLLGAG